MKLKGRLIVLGVLPVFFMGILVLIVAETQVKISLEKERAHSLESVAYSVEGIYKNKTDDPYREENGQVYKGDFNISESGAILDELKAETKMELTFFYGDVRAVSTITDKEGKRVTGTKADSDVTEQVLRNGENCFMKNVTIGGSPYYGFYIPVRQPDGGTVGMFFAGISKESSQNEINRVLFIILITVVAVMAICTVTSAAAASSIAKAIKASTGLLKHMAEGNLDIFIENKAVGRKDEIGETIRSTETLQKNFVGILKSIMRICISLTDASGHLDKTAVQTASATEQVERAIADIARGAAAQAGETQQASEDILLMGKMIEQTTDEMVKLEEKASAMNLLSEQAEGILSRLSHVTGQAGEAVGMIYRQTHTTNESALKIKDATEIITAIAEETNLLSLNASIEAARAGDQGRGFAVVASQIQKLAEQSNESARIITEIIKSLMNDSSQAVVTMNQVNEIIATQAAQVETTGDIFSQIRIGLQESIDCVNVISQKTEKLDRTRTSVVDTVQNLTAIAQENASGTEETSAATEEVAASIASVAGLSTELAGLARRMEEEIKVFKLQL